MNVARTGILLAGMTALFLTIGFLLGGQAGMLIALAAALGMNAFAFWKSDSMVLRMHNAVEVDGRREPELYNMVQRLAADAQLPMPRVFVIETDQPNAFATGRNPENAAVAATRGIMRLLNREELEGVMAHELAHVQNRDTLIMTVAATISGAIGFLSQFAFMFRGGSGQRVNPLVTMAIMIFAPMAAMVVQMAISRTREYAADRRGAEICGNPVALASALERLQSGSSRFSMQSVERHPETAHLFILNPLRSKGMAALFRTHPPTDERIRRLLALPDPRRGISSRSGGSVPPAGNR